MGPRIKDSWLREVVLVGGGHSHIQVLEHFATDAPPESRLTLVVDRPISVYSGMVPGLVAGQYFSKELEIDSLALAQRAHARVIIAKAVGIDAQSRRVVLEDRSSVLEVTVSGLSKRKGGLRQKRRSTSGRCFRLRWC